MRRDGVTASEMPIITGNRPGLLTLWAVKRRLMEPEPPDEATAELWALGHAMEPIIAERYTAMTGRPVRRVNRMVRHREIDWAYASLDRVSAVAGEDRIVELKWAPNRRWTDGPEPIPPEVQDQVQFQCLVSGYGVADVAVLNGSRVEIHTIVADRDYQDDLLFLARDFRDHVERGVRPAVDGSEDTRRALARLHPRESGVILAPSLEMDELAAQLRGARTEAKTAADWQSTLENSVRALLGDAPGVEGEGYRISWTKNADSTRTDWKAVAGAYRKALAMSEGDADAIESLHTRETEGPRVLRTRFINEEGKWT